MTTSEEKLITVAHLAHEWGVSRRKARGRAVGLAKKLRIKQSPVRSDSGQLTTGFEEEDAARIKRAYADEEERQAASLTEKQAKEIEIEFEINTARRPDVMTIYKIANKLGIKDRGKASQIVRRLEKELKLKDKRIPARSPDNKQPIIAYMTPHGEQIIALYRERTQKKEARRTERETRKRQRDAIPRALPPGAQSKVFYLIDLSGRGGHYKIGWSSDFETRLQTFRQTNKRLKILKTWSCPRKLDGPAMDTVFKLPCVSRVSAKPTDETFDTTEIERVVEALDTFFDNAN